MNQWQLWFQEWAQMFLVVYTGTHVSEQYQMASMINTLTLEQLQRFRFRPRVTQLTKSLKLPFRRYSPGPCQNNSQILKPPAWDNETPRAFHLWVPCPLHQYWRQQVSTVEFEIVVQLQRKKTPWDRPWGWRRGRGPQGQGGCQRGTQWRLSPYPPHQRQRPRWKLQKGMRLPWLFSLLPTPDVRKWSLQLSRKRLSFSR